MSDFDEEFFCSLQWADENTQAGANLLNTFYKVVISLYIFLTLTATLGNSLILVALHKDSSLHPPSKLLLRSLSITDLCVGAISQPIIITCYVSALNGNSKLCRVFEYSAYVVNTIFSGVSLSTLTAISVDRLLALLLRLRYRQVVTVKRVRAAVFVFWFNSIVIGIIYVLNSFIYYIVSGVLAILFVSVSTYSYTRIFRTIRRQQAQVQDAHGGQITGLNMARYKKTVFNALWVHLTLVACYLPFVVATTVVSVLGVSHWLLLVVALAIFLVCVNSSLNPLLYCWKIKEVRQAVKETIRQICACFSN